MPTLRQRIATKVATLQSQIDAVNAARNAQLAPLQQSLALQNDNLAALGPYLDMDATAAQAALVAILNPYKP